MKVEIAMKIAQRHQIEAIYNMCYGIWEGVPLNRIKSKEKTANSINMIFCKCYQNRLGQLLKQYPKLYQLWGPIT